MVYVMGYCSRYVLWKYIGGVNIKNKLSLVTIIGEGVALGSMVMWMFTFIIATSAGVHTGNYRLVIDTNMYMEHYWEMAMIFIGFWCYLYCIWSGKRLRWKGRKHHEDKL